MGLQLILYINSFLLFYFFFFVNMQLCCSYNICIIGTIYNAWILDIKNMTFTIHKYKTFILKYVFTMYEICILVLTSNCQLWQICNTLVVIFLIPFQKHNIVKSEIRCQYFRVSNRATWHETKGILFMII